MIACADFGGRSNWRIYCLTPVPDDNLMWAHYGNNHTGVCLEFQVKLHSSLWLKPVVYAEFLPIAQFKNIEKLIPDIMLTKDRKWSHEKEYRILARERNSLISPWNGVIVENYFLKLNPGALKSIIVGCQGGNSISGVQLAQPRN